MDLSLNDDMYSAFKILQFPETAFTSINTTSSV